jgi:hypothetical protein
MMRHTGVQQPWTPTRCTAAALLASHADRHVCAAASQGLDGMSPARVALAAVPVCAAWSGVAYSLGRRQEV